MTSPASVDADDGDLPPPRSRAGRWGPPRKPAARPGASAAPQPSLGWGDRRLWLLLLLVCALQCATLARVEGYALADSVEYMDRAQAVARGESLDPGTVRSFAFSALLVPFFWIAEQLGSLGRNAVVDWVRGLQMLIGLLSVACTARLGARLWGRGAGLCAGLLLGSNPVFLQYTVEPLAGVAALLFTLLAIERVLERGGFSQGLLCGACFGLAVLMEFKVLPIAGLACLFALLRERWSGRAFLTGLCGGLLLFLTAQCLLDLWVYGSFGSSLWTYVLENAGGISVRLLSKLGQRELATQIYTQLYGAPGSVEAQATFVAGQSELRALQDEHWYWHHLLTLCLCWPAAALVGLGALRALLRPRWKETGLLLVCGLSLYLMSQKGSKSFRLWLPLLPLVALLGALGFAWLAGTAGKLRLWLAGALALAAGILGPALLAHANLTKYGGFWKALDTVNALAEEQARFTPEHPLRVSCGYHWAVQYRSAPAVQLEKLPEHLDRWKSLGEAERVAILERFGELDAFIGHQQLLTQDTRIMDVLNRNFEVAALFYEPLVYEELGPIYVLQRRTGAATARTFFEVFEGEQQRDPAAYQAALEHPVSVDFRRRLPDGSVRQMVLLGWDLETGLAEDELFWITYHWYAGPLEGKDYTVTDRFTDQDGHGFNNNHAPAYGVRPTSSWPAGAIVRESYALPFRSYLAFGFGGNHRRGEVVPAQLWLALPEYDQQQVVVGGLNAFRPSAKAPYGREQHPARPGTQDGRRFSKDNLLLVGGFFLPVPAAVRVPDDGRPFLEPILEAPPGMVLAAAGPKGSPGGHPDPAPPVAAPSGVAASEAEAGAPAQPEPKPEPEPEPSER